MIRRIIMKRDPVAMFRRQLIRRYNRNLTEGY